MPNMELLLVGCGEIAARYVNGLAASTIYTLVGVCDSNPRCKSRDLFASTPFFRNLERAVVETMPKAALIATPPESHLRIFRFFAERGIPCLIEKPMVSGPEELKALFRIASNHGVSATCMLHWVYADEVCFLRDYFRTEPKPRNIEITIHDDYACADGMTIRNDRRGLFGAWLDSGINALSYAGQILNLTNAVLTNKQSFLDDSSNQPVYVLREYAVDGACLKIEIDWRTPSREKTSKVITDTQILYVNHSEQIIHNDKNEVVFSQPTNDRLASHYYNLLTQLPLSMASSKETQMLHQLLFQE